MKNKFIGSSFNDFLKDEGMYEEATAHAVKRVLAWQVEQAMAGRGISKNENGQADENQPRAARSSSRS